MNEINCNQYLEKIKQEVDKINSLPDKKAFFEIPKEQKPCRQLALDYIENNYEFEITLQVLKSGTSRIILEKN